MRIDWTAAAPCVTSVLQVVLSLCAFTGGFHDLAVLRCPTCLWQQLQATAAESQADLLLLNAACAVVTVASVLLACTLSVPCVRYGRQSVLRWAFGLLYSLFAAYGLVKVALAPTLGVAFWMHCCVMFSAATIAGFQVDRVCTTIYAWAIQRTAARYMGPGWSPAPPAKAPAADGKKPGKAGIGRLMRLSLPDLPYLLVGFAFLTGAAVGNTFLPNLTGNVIDAVAIDENPDEFKRQVILLLLVALGTALAAGVRAWAFTIALARLRIRLRDRLFRALMIQELGFFDGSSTGDLTSRLSSDTTAVSDALSLNVNVFLRSLIQALGSLVFMFVLSWRLTLLAFCTVPPTILIAQGYGKYIARLSKASQKRLAECNRIAEEALSAMATVRSFAGEQREADRHADVLADYYTLQKDQAEAYSLYSLITTALPTLVIVLVLWVGGRLVTAGELSGGVLVSFVLYQFSLAASFASMGDIFSGLMSAVGAAEKVFSLIDREPRMHTTGTQSFALAPVETPATATTSAELHAAPAVLLVPAVGATTVTLDAATLRRRGAPAATVSAVDGTGSLNGGVADPLQQEAPAGTAQLARHVAPPPLSPCAPSAFSGSIEFTAVTFAFPTRPEVAVLRDFSLHIRPGEVTALVGGSGGGKSSIIKLLQRLYEPDRGTITLSGLPLAAYDHEWLHRAVSCVMQEPVLFARPVWENVTYGLDVETEDRVGGPRALVHFPGTMPAYTHVRAGPKGAGCTSGSVLGGGGGGTWVSDANSVDNVGAVIATARVRHRLIAEYRRQARAAVDAITVRARERLTRALLLQQAPPVVVAARASVLPVGTASAASDEGGAYATLAAGDGGKGDSAKAPLLAPEVGGGGGEHGISPAVLRQLPPEALLSAACPHHRWNAGTLPRDRIPAALRTALTMSPDARERKAALDTAAAAAATAAGSGGDKKGKKGAADAADAAVVAAAAAAATGGGKQQTASRQADNAADKVREARRLQRARRVREWIRAHQREGVAPAAAAAGAAAGVHAAGCGCAACAARWRFDEWEPLPQGASASPPAGGLVRAPSSEGGSAAGAAADVEAGAAQTQTQTQHRRDSEHEAGDEGGPSISGGESAWAVLFDDFAAGGDEDDGDAAGGGEEAALGLDKDSAGLPAPTPTLAVMRQCVTAARLANAAGFVRELLPDAYDTGMAERGGNCSGGQRQRLCIARAVARNCSVICLDEATSALDAESEALVTDALNKVMAGRTVVVVAHRLSTVRHAHRICVVARGRIVEEGTHEALLARGPGGAYAKLVRRQMATAPPPGTLPGVGADGAGAVAANAASDDEGEAAGCSPVAAPSSAAASASASMS